MTIMAGRIALSSLLAVLFLFNCIVSKPSKENRVNIFKAEGLTQDLKSVLNNRLADIVPDRKQNFVDSLLKEFRDGYVFSMVQQKREEGCHGLDPEVCMNISEIITYNGYPCEDYTVQTEDGYLLSVQRIKHGLNNKNLTNRPVVFLQHGLLCSATNWVINLVNESLGFILADAGYEVWLGNSRGNTYSRKHRTLDPSQDEFWAWSWDEMGKYDFPAMIDFALNMSGKSSLYYVGHSQGTTQAFAHLSLNPDFEKKIKIFIALAPVATVGHMKSPIRLLSELSDQELYFILRRRDFLPNYELIKFLADTVCEEKSIRFICEDILFLIAGFDTTNLNKSRLAIYLNHTPAGASVQDIVHFVQGYRSNLFQMYNYDSTEENIKHYNQSEPPVYNVSKIQQTPIVAFYGDKDWLADLQDVTALLPQLKTLKAKYLIPGYDHLDFIWGENANIKVYAKVVEIIQNDERV